MVAANAELDISAMNVDTDVLLSGTPDRAAREAVASWAWAVWGSAAASSTFTVGVRSRTRGLMIRSAFVVLFRPEDAGFFDL